MNKAPVAALLRRTNTGVAILLPDSMKEVVHYLASVPCTISITDTHGGCIEIFVSEYQSKDNTQH